LSASAMTTVSPAVRPLTISIALSPVAPVTTRLVDRMPFVTTWTVPEPVPVGVTADAGRTTAAFTVFVVIVTPTRELSGRRSPPDGMVITVAYVVVDELDELDELLEVVVTAAKFAVVVGNRLILEIVPSSVVPPMVLVTFAACPVDTWARLASGTGTLTSMVPVPMITAAAVALACWPTTKGIDATLPAMGLVMVAWFNWSCAWASAMFVVSIVDWSVISVAAVTVPLPLRESPAAAAA
jgi:hypothetical protein